MVLPIIERSRTEVGKPWLRVDDLLEVGAKLRDGGSRYRVTKVEHPPNPQAFGHAWADVVNPSG